MSETIKNRYDFTILFDVRDGNPNGDPDDDNRPRTDPLTEQGIVTDMCIKRKIRDYVLSTKAGEPGYDIYVQRGITLNAAEHVAWHHLGVEPNKSSASKAKEKNPNLALELRKFVCESYYDVRAFGGVLTTLMSNNLNFGQVRGPIQLCLARSIDPVDVITTTITRITVNSEDEAKTKMGMIGERHFVRYGLYRMDGFISASLANDVTGFSEADLELFWEAIERMFDDDRSAGRGLMTTRKLIIFKHDSQRGNAPSWKLFDTISVERKDPSTILTDYSDYEVTIDYDSVPQGVSCFERV